MRTVRARWWRLTAGGLAVMLFSVAGSEPTGSRMSISLEGTQNGQHFPVLLIHLKRDDKDAGHIRVRFPEGIDAWQSNGSHTRFYQDVRSPVWPAELAPSASTCDGLTTTIRRAGSPPLPGCTFCDRCVRGGDSGGDGDAARQS